MGCGSQPTNASSGRHGLRHRPRLSRWINHLCAPSMRMSLATDTCARCRGQRGQSAPISRRSPGGRPSRGRRRAVEWPSRGLNQEESRKTRATTGTGCGMPAVPASATPPMTTTPAATSRCQTESRQSSAPWKAAARAGHELRARRRLFRPSAPTNPPAVARTLRLANSRPAVSARSHAQHDAGRTPSADGAGHRALTEGGDTVDVCPALLPRQRRLRLRGRRGRRGR